MKIRDNKLLLFNSMMLLNKREVVESFDDFVEHHRQIDNEEGYSEGKRKILLSLCDEFRNELNKKDIPALTKPWFYYEYAITNDSIKLSLFKCDEIEFGDDGEMSSMISSEEYILVEVKCKYLSVEQYAELSNVSTTTIRQWIRRGKLRTAKKKGRDWLIPSLADKPQRGFQSVTYHWTELNSDIIDNVPFLENTNSVYIFQDDEDKKKFYAITDYPGDDNYQKIELSIKEREQLEIILIASPEVEVEDIGTGVIYVPAKRNSSLPILAYQDEKMSDRIFVYRDIVVQQATLDTVYFSPNGKPRDALDDYPSTYLVPIEWTFWGIPNDCEDFIFEAGNNCNYTDCTRLGELSGYLILCKQMVADGYNPLIVCDDESADLGYIMSALINNGSPLNEWTGDSSLDVLYIHELIIEESLCDQGLGSRILQEVPRICQRLKHVVPDILAYYTSPIEPISGENENGIALDDIDAEQVIKMIYSDDKTKEGSSNIIYFPAKFQCEDEAFTLDTKQCEGDPPYLENFKNFRIIDFYQMNGFQELRDTRLMYAYTKM